MSLRGTMSPWTRWWSRNAYDTTSVSVVCDFWAFFVLKKKYFMKKIYSGRKCSRDGTSWYFVGAKNCIPWCQQIDIDNYQFIDDFPIKNVWFSKSHCLFTRWCNNNNNNNNNSHGLIHFFALRLLWSMASSLKDFRKAIKGPLRRWSACRKSFLV